VNVLWRGKVYNIKLEKDPVEKKKGIYMCNIFRVFSADTIEILWQTPKKYKKINRTLHAGVEALDILTLLKEGKA